MKIEHYHYLRELELETAMYEARQILAYNPYHPSLRIHRLKSKLADLHSISINLNYRITLKGFYLTRQSFWLMSAVIMRCITHDSEKALMVIGAYLPHAGH